MHHRNCTEITPQCPVEKSVYGYYPELAPNAVLCAIFSLCLLLQFGLAVWYRTAAFGTVVIIGCAWEMAGYIGRLMMRSNPFGGAFILQATGLILAPSFLAAGIYLTLKHIVIHLGSQYSRLRPVLWVWIFVGADVICVLLQGGGGGIASGANDTSTANMGNDITVAGLIFSVVIQAFCILLVLDFSWTLRKHKNEVSLSELHSETSSRAFRFYVVCTSVAFLCIFIRSIYRIPELVGGWGNSMQRTETEFLILDGMMIAIASILLTVAHPGIFFPAISAKALARRGKRNGGGNEKGEHVSDEEQRMMQHGYAEMTRSTS